MALKEITLTQDDIDFIICLMEEREEAINAKKRMPALARATALNEVESLKQALSTIELF